MLYVDIPTPADLATLAGHRQHACVSIYLRTTPVTQETAGDRIELKNLAKEAARQLESGGGDKRHARALLEQLDELVDDDEFWRFQARSLAIFATPDNVRTFRLPNALEPVVAVSDRFHLKPLLRAVTFSNTGFVLALAEGSARLIEVSADLPAVAVKVDGMPRDAGSAVGRSSVNDRSPSGRIHGDEGQKVLLHQYARKVDRALRGLLAGSDVPLVLAASQPLASIFRSVNTCSRLTAMTIEGNPEALTETQLAERARAVLDEIHSGEIAAWGRRFEERNRQGRATTDIAMAARAATFGAVDFLLADIDGVMHGTLGESDGAITVSGRAGPDSYDVVDEIARRVIESGGRVWGVRKSDIPGGKALAAILRYAV